MKQNKTVFNGPIIRYHSVTMPKLEEEDDDDNNDHEEVNTSNQKISDLSKQQSDKKSRNFISKCNKISCDFYRTMFMLKKKFN